MNDNNIIGRVYGGTANNLFQKDLPLIICFLIIIYLLQQFWQFLHLLHIVSIAELLPKQESSNLEVL